jgi:hypothetical protein
MVALPMNQDIVFGAQRGRNGARRVYPVFYGVGGEVFGSWSPRWQV